MISLVWQRRCPLSMRSGGMVAIVGVLLTRAEEVGFIGAIGACHKRDHPESYENDCPRML